MWKRRTNCSVGLRAFSSMFRSSITVSIHVRKGGNEDPGELLPPPPLASSEDCLRATAEGRWPDVFLSSVLISSICSISFLSLNSTVSPPLVQHPQKSSCSSPDGLQRVKTKGLGGRASIHSHSYSIIRSFTHSFIHPSSFSLSALSPLSLGMTNVCILY